MSYDWKKKSDFERFSIEWFDDIDRRFIHGARLFAHDVTPFDRIIPFSNIRGKDVLEIGCGMGLQTELLAKAGARLVSVDLSETSIEATSIRSRLKGFDVDLRRMDAVDLAFPDESFDFVWSWGVIHHSAQTGGIVRQIHRVLRPGGEVRVMVYNLEGMPAYLVMMGRYLFGFWRGRSLDECLWQSSDGYMARYYTRDSLTDLFSIFFKDVAVKSYGQDADAVPLPQGMRRIVMNMVSEASLSQLANKRGALLHVTARKAAA
jgi:2-polyprenyl-3-methyl-5-hydroxy-6-metoxy-1,4-benzoquinol methylase